MGRIQTSTALHGCNAEKDDKCREKAKERTRTLLKGNDGCRQKKNAADIRLMTDEIVCRKMKMLSIKTEGCQAD